MSKLCFFPILLLTGGLAAVRASTPLLSELPLQDSVTVHKEITWKFKHPMRVGTFVNSDFYVVGPCTVTAISPSPTVSPARNGSTVNLDPSYEGTSFDDRSGNYTADPAEVSADQPESGRRADFHHQLEGHGQ